MITKNETSRVEEGKLILEEEVKEVRTKVFSKEQLLEERAYFENQLLRINNLLKKLG